MRKIRETLRLHFDGGLGQRPIARCLNISRTTVGDYLRRAAATGLGWPLPEALTDQQLYALLFPSSAPVAPAARPLLDFTTIHTELKRKGMTLMLLWEEYLSVHPQGYRYSQFCELYRQWANKLKLSMRQNHKAGEKLFVDYAGQTVPIVDPQTGEIHEAQVFVAVLGASSYTFAEATLTQGLEDWLSSHVRAFGFFGGVPELVIPDNLKSAVSKPCRYEPDLNPSYAELAEHYATAVTGTGAQTEGQGQGRGRCPAGGALDPGPPAQADLLQSGRSECRHRCAIDRSEQPPLQETARLPQGGLRDDRSSGVKAAPRAKLRLCPLEEGPSRHRLSC